MDWFVPMIQALVAGDADSYAVVHNIADVKYIRKMCSSMHDAGLTRPSRKGWETIDHPRLGTLQWKIGIDFRTAGEYFFFRLNGKLILRAWPNAGYRKTHCEWVTGQDVESSKKRMVERMLGTLQDGTGVSMEERGRETSEFRDTFPNNK